MLGTSDQISGHKWGLNIVNIKFTISPRLNDQVNDQIVITATLFPLFTGYFLVVHFHILNLL